MSVTNMSAGVEAPQVSKATNKICPTFTCFPNLPLELRLKVFQYMTKEPRTVHIDLKPGGVSEPFVLGARARTPTVLYLCKESREEALRIFARSQKHFNTPQFDRNLYINLETDTLMFARSHILALFFQHAPYSVRDQICSLAFRTGPGPSRYMDPSFLTCDNVQQYLSRCRKLNDFTIVADRFELFSNLRMPYWQDDYLKYWPRMLKYVVKEIEKKCLSWKRPEMRLEIWAAWERPDCDMLGELRRCWAEGREYLPRVEEVEGDSTSSGDSH